MSRARGRTSEVAVLVGLAGICVVLWRLRGSLEPVPPPVVSAPADLAARPAPAATPEPPPAVPESSRSDPRADPRAQQELQELPPPRGSDTVDPCTAGVEPTIPPDYDTTDALGITVAWSSDRVPKPWPHDTAVASTEIAHLVNGLLAEAAALTGTPRRARLTVVVYPSREDMIARTGGPAWAGGLYDGGAVRLVFEPSTDLGVEISALRHELMHAQLHAAVGCMPAWLNEGLAMYFAGTPPARPWVRMLRSPDAFDLRSLQTSTFTMLSGDRAERAYAESLAMIVFILEQAGEAGLGAAVHAVQAAVRESPRAGKTLWERLYPRADHRAVLDALARKVFGVALGEELDALFTATVCCYGGRTVTSFGCRTAPPRQDKTVWYDRSRTPSAVCRTTW